MRRLSACLALGLASAGCQTDPSSSGAAATVAEAADCERLRADFDATTLPIRRSIEAAAARIDGFDGTVGLADPDLTPTERADLLRASTRRQEAFRAIRTRCRGGRPEVEDVGLGYRAVVDTGQGFTIFR